MGIVAASCFKQGLQVDVRGWFCCLFQWTQRAFFQPFFWYVRGQINCVILWIRWRLDQYRALNVHCVWQETKAWYEIQKVCDKQSGIMLRLLLVKLTSFTFQCTMDAVGRDNSSIDHGTHLLKYLVQPWARSNCVVYAVFCFASIQSAKMLY